MWRMLKYIGKNNVQTKICIKSILFAITAQEPKKLYNQNNINSTVINEDQACLGFFGVWMCMWRPKIILNKWDPCCVQPIEELWIFAQNSMRSKWFTTCFTLIFSGAIYTNTIHCDRFNHLTVRICLSHTHNYIHYVRYVVLTPQVFCVRTFHLATKK